MTNKNTLILIFLVLLQFTCGLQRNKILIDIKYGTKLLQFSEEIPSFLINAVESIKNISDAAYKSQLVCWSCEQVIDNILALRKSESTRDVMIDYLNKLCMVYTDWGTEGCKGYVNIDIDTILYIIDHKKDFTPARFCAIRLQSYQCVDPDADPWIIPLPPPPSTNRRSPTTHGDPNELQILHLTDIHYDPLYIPGSNAKCIEPLCCESGKPDKPEDAAGYWADYNVCDMPLHSVDDLFQRIKIKHKHIDLVYFTGDIVSHRSWTTSVSSNREAIRTVLQYFGKTFPNTTVLPILGNHEPHPADYFSPKVALTTNVTTEWIFDLAVTEWLRWLPNDTESTIKQGGFYTVLISPGFRIVALNSNVCYTSNLWLLYDDKDPFDQLVWLVKVLQDAEANGEKVHLLSHIPPGEASCHKQWSQQFAKIVLRFADTIVGQFNGHTHVDEFRLFLDNNEAVNIAYNGASFTTFVGYNPNYRIYKVELTNFTVTDYNQYIYNLTDANTNSTTPPQWYKLYSFKEAYGLKDLTLQSLKSLYDYMSTNLSTNPLVDTYYRFRGRDSDIYLSEGCDTNCKRQLICYITAVETNKTLNC